MPSAPEPKPIYGAINQPFRWKHAPSKTDKDAIRILDNWDTDNITSFACEPLARWTQNRSRVVTMNVGVREDFLALWDAWERTGCLNILKSQFQAKLGGPVVRDGWAGAWCARYKRGVAHDGVASHLSNHATGHAFDICPARYPLGVTITGPDPIHLLVPIAKKYGWKWGGEFKRSDPMHFQHSKSPFP